MSTCGVKHQNDKEYAQNILNKIKNNVKVINSKLTTKHFLIILSSLFYSSTLYIRNNKIK